MRIGFLLTTLLTVSCGISVYKDYDYLDPSPERASWVFECMRLSHVPSKYVASDEEEHDMGGPVRACNEAATELFPRKRINFIKACAYSGPCFRCDDQSAPARFKQACQEFFQ